MIDALDRPVPVAAISVALVLAAVLAPLALADPAARGVVIGAALGLVNLILGTHLTQRSLEGEPGTALLGVVAGFAARFFVLVALLGVFTYATGLAVSPAAFGFTFVAFVFVYFGIESAVALRFQRREAA